MAVEQAARPGCCWGRGAGGQRVWLGDLSLEAGACARWWARRGLRGLDGAGDLGLMLRGWETG